MDGRWYLRGYSGSKPIGDGAIFGEPQPWAILAGAPSTQQATVLVHNIRRFLTGIGAPAVIDGPAKIGSALSPAARDPGVTEPPTAGAFDGASQYVGGVWFDVNGWLTWALSQLDGVVPGAAGYAWSEYTRNTLGAHAHAFPDHWDGTISIDDACNAFYAHQPARCGIPLYSTYEGQITEQPTWMVMGAIHLAGVTALEHGFVVTPHLKSFSLRLPDVGVERAAHMERGYFRIERRERLVVEVGGVPPNARDVRTWSSSRRVSHHRRGRLVVFTLAARSMSRNGLGGDMAMSDPDLTRRRLLQSGRRGGDLPRRSSTRSRRWPHPPPAGPLAASPPTPPGTWSRLSSSPRASSPPGSTSSTRSACAPPPLPSTSTTSTSCASGSRARACSTCTTSPSRSSAGAPRPGRCI